MALILPRRGGLTEYSRDNLRFEPLSPFPRFQPAILTRAERPIEILVIGAGLAGLSSAYQLAKAGHRVTVLEARHRVGGKVHTIRGKGFDPAFFPEAGGLLIPGFHLLTSGYADHFGLTRRLVGIRMDQGVAHVRGVTLPNWMAPAVPWPVPLRATEQAGGWGGMWDDYITGALVAIGDPRASGWPDASALAYDRITFAQFLRERGASEGAIEILRLGYADVYGDGVDSVSALSLLRDFALSASGTAPFQQSSGAAAAAIDPRNHHIVGGNDLLPRAFADSAELRHQIVLGKPARRIEQNARRVRITCENGDQYEADRVICTVPFSVLRRMELPDPISAEKRRAIQLLEHTSAMRIWVQTTHPIWTASGVNGLAVTDLPAMFIHAPSAYLLGSSKGMLEALITGRQARAMSVMSKHDAINLAIDSFDRVYPGVARLVEHAAWHRWDKQRWSRGDYAAFRPGDMERLQPFTSTPEGRIHFAGEHTSLLPGWMQGAVESGHRVAIEVHNAP